MGTVNAVTVGIAACAIAAFGALRWGAAQGRGGRSPAPPGDLKAIEAALAGDGGTVLRARRDMSGNLIDRNEYLDERTGARLYHVTLQVGAVTVRRRVAVRDGAPASVLP